MRYCLFAILAGAWLLSAAEPQTAQHGVELAGDTDLHLHDPEGK